jgi:serine/threonine protein kinase
MVHLRMPIALNHIVKKSKTVAGNQIMNADEPMVSLRGWLREKCLASQREEFLYCTVVHDVMRGYLRSDSPVPVMTIPISSIAEVFPIDSPQSPAFRLRMKTNRIRQFGCASAEDRERWMCALSEAQPNDKVDLDSFRVGRAIGRGAFGTVYLVRKKSSGAVYAMKEISKRHVKSTSRESRVIAERNILMRASHQFVTKLHYAFQTPTEFYFVLEYVGGGDLQTHLERGVVLSPFQIRLYLAEVVIALQILHRLGVIYRDLKPENIILDTNGHIKLADFGLSRFVDREKPDCYSMCGTYEYIPPEMIRDLPQTFCVDWWALGILAFRLTTGYLPFRNLNRRRLFEAIIKKPVVCPPHMEPSTAAFIRALLEKDPSKRLGAPGTDIAAHPYFEGLSWPRVAKMGYEPEFKPPSPEPFYESDLDTPLPIQEPEPDSPISLPGFSFQAEPLARSAVSYDNLATA